MRYMSELIDAYDMDRGEADLGRLESALMAVGPLIHRGTVYAIADARPVESIEILRYVRRADTVPVPTAILQEFPTARRHDDGEPPR